MTMARMYIYGPSCGGIPSTMRSRKALARSTPGISLRRSSSCNSSPKMLSIMHVVLCEILSTLALFVSMSIGVTQRGRQGEEAW